MDGSVNSGNSYLSVSDSKLKKDTVSFSGGLGVVRNLRVFSYRMNGKAGFDTTHINIGVIAEEVAQIAPYAVDTFFAKLDSTDTVSTALLSVKNEAIMYISINAIKELDSIISAPPDAPVIISPADGAVGGFRGTAFIWHPVSAGIVLYRAQLAKDSAFSNIVFDQSGITDTTTFFNVCDTLPATFYWRVNAKNNAGTGPFSQVFSFTDTAKCLIGPEPIPIGRTTAVAFESTSDSSFKTNLAPVTNALDKVSQLNGLYYDWLHTNPNYEFDSTRQIGFIAQDVQAVVPEVVHTDTNGFFTLDYGRMIPVLVEAIKEQQFLIISLQAALDTLQQDSLAARLNAVEQCINSLPPGLCGNNMQQNKTTGTGNANQYKTKTAGVLYQNNPNPFSEHTEIRYYIPEEAAAGILFIYDLQGKQVKKFDKLPKGNQSVHLPARSLYAGMFIYTLIIDGEDVGTKRMILTE